MAGESSPRFAPERLSRWRSEVIERFINLDTVVMVIICQHYFKRAMKPFILDVLYDEQCPFALRRNILTKIVPGFSTSKEFQDLCRLNRIRNLFAHCNLMLVRGPDPSSGNLFVPDPKGAERELNFQDLYEEFARLEPPLLNYLWEIYIGMGGSPQQGPPPFSGGQGGAS